MTLTSKEGGAVVENVMRFIIIVLFFLGKCKKNSAREFPLDKVELCTKGNHKREAWHSRESKKCQSRKSKNVKALKREFPSNQVVLCTVGNEKMKPGIADNAYLSHMWNLSDVLH